MEKEAKEKISTYYTLQARVESIERQQNFIVEKISEIAGTISILDELKERKKSIFSLGSGVYVAGEVKDKNKFLVQIGAGIILEKDLEEIKNILKRRKDDLEKILVELQKEKNEIMLKMQALLPEIKKALGG